MNTPICDFVQEYNNSKKLRLHMPGHKGASLTGWEWADITEIPGADSLYEAEGIIAQSEANASALFGSHTLYSTEGSSLCIKAMIYLATANRESSSQKPLILAGRNAHKAFISAAALCDTDVEWIRGEEDGYLACSANPQQLEDMLKNAPYKPAAVYITSPDYLGNTADIGAISDVCHRQDVLLLVDNAHGAYMKFLPESRHPMDLGADMCCDSAHKTLPVLTGGAYLHISDKLMSRCGDMAKPAMELFGSTSPSYLILQSLDMANKYIAEGYRESLAEFTAKICAFKEKIASLGYHMTGKEPLKLTIATKSYGYTGTELAEELAKLGIVCEFADMDYIVMMFTPETGEEGLDKLYTALKSIPQKPPIDTLPPALPRLEQAMTIREAVMSPKELIPSSECEGKILAMSSVGCPPAVPIVVCGERIDRQGVKCLEYYGIEKCLVIKQSD